MCERGDARTRACGNVGMLERENVIRRSDGGALPPFHAYARWRPLLVKGAQKRGAQPWAPCAPSRFRDIAAVYIRRSCGDTRRCAPWRWSLLEEHCSIAVAHEKHGLRSEALNRAYNGRNAEMRRKGGR